MDNNKVVTFIGAGNMSGAIIAGLIANGFPANNIWASSPSIENKSHLKNLKINLTTDNIAAASNADIIVLGVKPHLITTICHELKTLIAEKKPLIASLAAGTKAQSIELACSADATPVVRVMPNIAAAVGASATILYANQSVTDEQRAFSESLFRSIGTIFWAADEAELDVLTPIAGSGPAYLFYVFEAMQEAAQKMGIHGEAAKLLVAETAIGAAKLVMESSEDFSSLRTAVTSPNGTTQAATDFLAKNNVKEIFIQAITTAHQRTKELSK